MESALVRFVAPSPSEIDVGVQAVFVVGRSLGPQADVDCVVDRNQKVVCIVVGLHVAEFVNDFLLKAPLL